MITDNNFLYKNIFYGHIDGPYLNIYTTDNSYNYTIQEWYFFRDTLYLQVIGSVFDLRIVVTDDRKAGIRNFPGNTPCDIILNNESEVQEFKKLLQKCYPNGEVDNT